MGIQVAARSKAWVCGSSIAGVARSNPARSMEVCRECCVLSGGGFCEGLITRPEESFRMWCVYLWLWSLDYEEALAHWGLSRHEKISVYVQWHHACSMRREIMSQLHHIIIIITFISFSWKSPELTLKLRKKIFWCMYRAFYIIVGYNQQIHN